jgi:HSP20 family protein
MAAVSKEKKEQKGVEPYRGGQMAHGMFEDMERMFDRYFRGLGPSWLPRVRFPEEIEVPRFDADIFDDGKNIILKAELPGVSKENVEIDITEDTITVTGEKQKEEKVERKNYYRLERAYGSFTRSFSLPAHIKPDEAKATFKDGILEVKSPKKEGAKKVKAKVE